MPNNELINSPDDSEQMRATTVSESSDDVGWSLTLGQCLFVAGTADATPEEHIQPSFQISLQLLQTEDFVLKTDEVKL